jgi:predicted ester cyclase
VRLSSPGRFWLGCTLALAACGKSKSADQQPEQHVDNATPPPKPEVKPDAKPAPKYGSAEAKLQRYLECWSAFNAAKDDVFASCFAADALREQVDSVPASVGQGAEKIVDMAKAQRASFPDLKVRPELVIINGNNIAAILHVAGTNTGETADLKATGKKLGVYEAEIALMADDGTFSKDSIYVDQPTVFHQLGLLPNDTSPAAITARATEPVTLISKGDATENANKALVEQDIEAVNKKNAKAIAAIVADDIRLTYHGEKQVVQNKKAYLKWLDDVLHTAKDGFVDVKGLWTAGDWVVISDVFSGTPSEAVVGKDSEPKHIETHVVQFYRVKGGKLAEQQIFANRLQTAVQLGMVDPGQLVQTLSKANK